MKINIITLAACLTILSTAFAQQNEFRNQLGKDSTDIFPQNITFPKINISSTRNKPVNASCAAYAGSYGIPSGATQGNVILFYEDSPTNPRYGQVVLADYSGCSIPSQPITVTRQCSSFVGSYGIASGSQGTFQITTEGNTYKPNYGSVISTDTSGCYVPPPIPPQPPGCYGTAIQTWTDAFSKNGKICAGQPLAYTAPQEIISVHSKPGYGSTGDGVLFFKCMSGGNNTWVRQPLFYDIGVQQIAPAQTCN